MSAPVESFAGTATIGAAEYSLPANGTALATLTTPGVFSLLLDLSAMTATEQYRLSVYEAVRAGGTKRLLDQQTISGAQTLPIYLYQPSVPLLNGWDVTLKKIAGTDCSISWSIRRHSDSDLAAIKAKTDALPAFPAAVGDIASPAAVATAVRLNLAAELAGVNLLQARVPAVPAAVSDIPTAGAIALATRTLIDAAPVPANVRMVNSLAIIGSGIEGTDPWRPA